MKYVIEKNGKVVAGPSFWNKRFATLLGLKGNHNVPEPGFEGGGHSLWPYEVVKVVGDELTTTGLEQMEKVGGTWFQAEYLVDVTLESAKLSRKTGVHTAMEAQGASGFRWRGMTFYSDTEHLVQWGLLFFRAKSDVLRTFPMEVEGKVITLTNADIMEISGMLEGVRDASLNRLGALYKKIDKQTDVSGVRDITWS